MQLTQLMTSSQVISSGRNQSSGAVWSAQLGMKSDPEDRSFMRILSSPWHSKFGVQVS